MSKHEVEVGAMWKHFVEGALVAGLLAALGAGKATAAPVVFTIDSTRSLLVLSGSLISGDIQAPTHTGSMVPQSFPTFSQQNLTNTLQARYEGTITADFNAVTDQIQFSGANIVAINGGSYRPNAFAANTLARSPGNHGGVIQTADVGFIELVVRELTANLTSASLAMMGSDYDWTFANSGQTLLLTAGRADYAAIGMLAGPLGSGTFDLTGWSQQNENTSSGSLALDGPMNNSTLTLTIPFQMSILQQLYGSDTPDVTDDIHVRLQFLGQLVGVAVPEAGSLLFVGLVGIVVGWSGHRRRSTRGAGD